MSYMQHDRARGRRNPKWAISPTDQELEQLLAWGKKREIHRPSAILRALVREYFVTTQGVTFDELPRHGGFRGRRPKAGDTVRFRVAYKVFDSKTTPTVDPGNTGIIKDVNRRLAIVGVEDGLVAARFRDLEIIKSADESVENEPSTI